MTTIGRGLIAAGLTMAVLVVPGAAQATTTIGQAPPTAGTPLDPGCMTQGAAIIDTVQLSNASGNSYEIPAGGGVITGWRTAITGQGVMRLRVYSPDSNVFVVTPIAESGPLTITSVQAGLQPTRIPVSGGEHIGFSLGTFGAPGCIYTNTGAEDIAVTSGNGSIGQPTPAGDSNPGILLNVAAELEADADKDGFGDETQDKCLGISGSADGCPALELGKPKANGKKGTATIVATLLGPGKLTLVGKNVRSQVAQVAGASDVPLTVKAKGKLRSKLKKSGKAKATVTITFTPTSGDPIEQTVAVKLKKKN